ncbi:MAG: hypothetical protein HFI19_06120 [Lachnospiraceae bacterium]|jgi:hypothetical protein|nr:hypothetical protein [Lachnospiraceae bacterium]
MMDYETFKQVITEQILNYMSGGFKNCTAEIFPVLKVNQKLDALGLFSSMKESRQFKDRMPLIYVNHIYEEYKRNGDLKKTLEMAALELREAYREKAESKGCGLLENAKDKLVVQLINTEQNKELLKTLPHRPFQDLSIVYRLVAEIGPKAIASSLVNKNVAKRLGMKESDLYEVAIINTKRLFPPVIKTMNEVLWDIAGDVMPADMAGTSLEENISGNMMYVISNEQQINGAVSMLYEEELHTLAEKLGTNLYLMPSSIHEAIAVPADIGDANELAEMVKDINMSAVCLEERLSNQVYYYDKETRELTLATDTLNKRLDQIVAEPAVLYGTKQSR